MKIEPRRTTINGQEYSLIPMAPMRAVEYAPKVMTTIVAAIGDNVGSVINGLKSGEMEKIGAILIQGLSSVDPAKFTALAKEAINHDVYSGSQQKLSDTSFFNEHFRQYPANYFKLAIWAIWEHSKDFIVGSQGDSQADPAPPE